MSSGIHPTPIYCRKCGYDLRGSVEFKRCPECGQPFDPADPKTFLSRVPGSRWKWTKRFLLLLLAVGVLLGGTWGWLYWGWKSEQNAVKTMGAYFDESSPLGGERLQRHLGSAGWVLDRVTDMDLPPSTTDADLVQLKELTRLHALGLRYTQITDAGLFSLRKFRALQQLDLCGTRIMGSGLINLKEFKCLQWLDLSDTQIGDAGLVNLKELQALQTLHLGHTRITDAGLVYLKELKGLRELDLSRTQVTPAGIKELRAALPECYISEP